MKAKDKVGEILHRKNEHIYIIFSFSIFLHKIWFLLIKHGHLRTLFLCFTGVFLPNSDFNFAGRFNPLLAFDVGDCLDTWWPESHCFPDPSGVAGTTLSAFEPLSLHGGGRGRAVRGFTGGLHGMKADVASWQYPLQCNLYSFMTSCLRDTADLYSRVRLE